MLLPSSSKIVEMRESDLHTRNSQSVLYVDGHRF